MYTEEQLDLIEDDEEKNRISIRLKRELERMREKYGG